MTPRRTLRVAAACVGAIVTATAPDVGGWTRRAHADEPPKPAASPQDIFFRDPDKATGQRIADLIDQFSSDGWATRRRARESLEALGWWSVEPLVAATRTREPPVKCSAILTLDAIADRRALEPLRDSVVREDGNQFVGAFAALALGRLHDLPATASFRAALARPRELEMLRSAVPLALARLRSPEALDLLREQVRESGATELVSTARILALGFFPEAALGPDGQTPSRELADALRSARRRERESALLAYVVATARTTKGRAMLLSVADDEPKPTVVMVALLGLAAFEGPEITERIAKAAASAPADSVREFACDLLIPRADRAALPTLLKLVQSPSGAARLRASAVLALGRIDAQEARDVVIERLRDGAPLVRAAAAVAAARSESPDVRTRALALLDARLHGGETDAKAKEVAGLARAVLNGERREVRWPEVGPERLFSTMDLTPRQRLMHAVNLRVEACLDLLKIANFQTDTEMTPHQLPTTVPGLDGGDGSGDGGDDGPTTPTPGPVPGGTLGNIGATRTSAWQELRDLKVELRRRPYFTEADLPLPPAAPTGDDGSK